MERLRLLDLKSDSSGIASALNLPATDPRFTAIVNQAQQSLLERPEKWWGTTQTYNVCASDDCFTWPRQFASIEAADICNQPVPLRNQWYEFQQNGAGIATGCSAGACCGGRGMFDRGTACCFQDIIGQGQIKVYADVTEDPAAKILLQGYDQNGNWIRTLNSGVWTDGEYVSISTTPTTSTRTFSSLVAVQKPATNGNVRLYQLTSPSTQVAIAIYESDEQSPLYRRSYVPGLSKTSCCNSPAGCGSNPGSTCGTGLSSVVVVAKIGHTPVTVDTDYLVLSSVPAFVDMCQSVLLRQQRFFDDAIKYETSAIGRLRAQLKHFQGDGAKQSVQVNSRHFNSAAVLNMI